MSAKSPDSLTFDLGTSRVLALVLGAVHLGAAAVAALLPVAVFVRIAIIGAVALSLYRSLWLHALRRSPAAVIHLTLNDDDECALQRRDASVPEEGRLIERWVHPQLTILVIRTLTRQWRPTNVVLAADAIAPETFRRLRVRLLQQAATASKSYRDPRSADPEKDSRA